MKRFNSTSLLSFIATVGFWSLFCLCQDATAFQPNQSQVATDKWQEQLLHSQALINQGEQSVGVDKLHSYALNGNGLAQFWLAFSLQTGLFDAAIIEQKKLGEACHWYQLSAENDIPMGAFKFAQCLAKATLIETDANAVNWFIRAAELGLSDGLCEAGKLMIAGDSELVNKTEGINLCLKSVEAGSSGAALYLAELFYQGDLVVKNDTFAFEYYKLANPKRNPLAAFRLGQFYDRGLVVEQDVEKSLYWYEMAASHGYSSAYLPCAALYWNAYEQLSEDRAKTLAKTYLWVSAAEVANDSLNVDSYDRNKIEDITLLRNAVLKEMPDGWQSRLDKQVAEHFLNLGKKG